MPTYILFRYLDCVHFVNYLHAVDLFIRIRLLSAVVGGRPRHIHGLRGAKIGYQMERYLALASAHVVLRNQ